MLLRASGKHEGLELDIDAITDTTLTVGLPNEAVISEAVAQLLTGTSESLATAVAACDAAIGKQASTDVLSVACAFNGITRVADATGIPLDPDTEAATDELRASTGIDNYSYQTKSANFQ